MKRALVLGGGGSVGIAWETAIVAGLLEGGVDVREADLIVGTSAGSVVGTHVAHGHDPRVTLEGMKQQPVRAIGGDPNRDVTHVTATFQLWASFDVMTPERCAQVGRMALEAKTIPEEDWVASFAESWSAGWPDKPLIITAVNCHSGEFVAWEKHHGVPIELAIASSCSVPALFPPVTIDGARYTDGGVRSATSADLTQRIEPDVVLMIATMGATNRGIGAIAARDIAREKAQLEAAGAKVVLLMFDQATKDAAGPNLMDPTKRVAVAATGYAQGLRSAVQIGDVWNRR